MDIFAAADAEGRPKAVGGTPQREASRREGYSKTYGGAPTIGGRGFSLIPGNFRIFYRRTITAYENLIEDRVPACLLLCPVPCASAAE
jgi:hypothetical protein